MTPSSKKFFEKCPTCGLLIECDSSQIGQTVLHDYCGKEVVVHDPALKRGPASEALQRFDGPLPSNKNAFLAERQKRQADDTADSSRDPTPIDESGSGPAAGSTRGESTRIYPSEPSEFHPGTSNPKINLTPLPAVESDEAFVDLASEGSSSVSNYDAQQRREIVQAADASDFNSDFRAKRKPPEKLKGYFRKKLHTDAIKSPQLDPTVDVRRMLADATKEKREREFGHDWDDADDSSQDGVPRSHRKIPRSTLLVGALAAVTALAVVYYVDVSSTSTDISSASTSNRHGDGIPASMQQVAEAFLQAPTIEEKLKYVRFPDRVAPLMTEFFSGPISVESFQNAPLFPFRKVQIGHFQYDTFMVGPRSQARLLSLVSTPDGWRVDWECFARHCPASFTDLLDGIVLDGAPYRVFVTDSDYYNFGYTSGDYKAYRIISPDVDEPIYGYVARPAKLESVLNALAQRANPQRCILELSSHSEENSERQQVVINRIVTAGWVMESELE